MSISVLSKAPGEVPKYYQFAYAQKVTVRSLTVTETCTWILQPSSEKDGINGRGQRLSPSGLAWRSQATAIQPDAKSGVRPESNMHVTIYIHVHRGCVPPGK